MRPETTSFDFDTPGSASPALIRSLWIGGSLVLLALLGLQALPDVPWPALPGFVWAQSLTYVFAGAVMTALLAYQAIVAASRALAALAGTTLFSALMFGSFFVSFPGTLTEGVWLGGSQSAVWTYQFEHIGFITGLAVSAVLALLDPRLGPPRANWTAWFLGLSALSAAAGTFMVLVRHDSLPLLLDPNRNGAVLPALRSVGRAIDVMAVVMIVLCLAASRTRSRARVWLALIALITAAESIMQSVPRDRFSSIWYTGRIIGMIGFLLLLVILILEVLRQSRELIARREQARLLTQIVEQSPSAQYVVDNRMRVLDVNAAFTLLTGFTREELIDKPLPILADPAGAKLASTLLERLHSQAVETLAMRVRLPRKAAPAIWVDWSAHAILDANGAVIGSAGTLVDASDDMALDLDTEAPIGMAIVDRERRFTQANAALCSMTGLELDQLMGAEFLKPFLEEDHDNLKALCNDITAGDRRNDAIEARLAGTDRWVLLYASRLSTADNAFGGATLQFVDISARKSAEAAAAKARAEIDYRAHYDDLTGLLNHLSLLECVDAELRDLSGNRHVAVVLLDVDGFQAVSNALTREQGDAVLRELGRMIESHSEATNHVARLAGDEFALVVNARDGIDVAQRVQRLMQEITNHEFGTHGNHVYLTVSVGVSMGRAGMVAADLVQEADMAMRQAQRSGRGNWQLFTHEYRNEVRGRIELTREMHEALDRDEFRSWYMPITRLDDGSLHGYEALVRWQSPHGLRAPDAFLRVAEETGLIVEVGRQVFDQAVRRLVSLPPTVRMAINASPTQLLRGDVYFHTKTLLTETGVAPERLVVEITEQALFETKKAADANIFQLAELGVGIHVDDFGSGYSSITHLRDFPVTGLKLDTSFTAGLESGHARSIEIAGILGELTHRLGIEGVAEGVETEGQVAKLRELGWELGQGWLFGKPSPDVAAA